MNQKEGVFQAVFTVFGEVDAVPATGAWTKAQSEKVFELVFLGFKSNTIEFKGGCPDDAKLKKYIPGLVNNWVRKDTRMNGGMKYEAKRPGSRTGSGDETLKAMKQLLSVTTDPSAKEQIQAAIETRIASLKPKTEINANALPESLRHLIPTAA